MNNKEYICTDFPTEARYMSSFFAIFDFLVLAIPSYTVKTKMYVGSTYSEVYFCNVPLNTLQERQSVLTFAAISINSDRGITMNVHMS